jgi:exopolysaccharide biosynthesis WecB/TagA/CpsF family protein
LGAALLRSEVSTALRVGYAAVTTPTKGRLLLEIANNLAADHSFAVVTVNLDHLVKLRQDERFRAAYSRHTHVVADGNPVVWLHRLAGHKVELVTGSDLVSPLMEMASRRDVPVALLGTTAKVLEAAARQLSAANPGLEIVAQIAPGAGFAPDGAEADDCIARIKASGARLCLVALGAPKQELFVARALETLPHCGFVSVGAGLDFLAGTQQRAPLWCRRLALEWLWRLVGNPRRLARRYRDCALILPGLVMLALRERFAARAAVDRAPADGADVADWVGDRKAAE